MAKKPLNRMEDFERFVETLKRTTMGHIDIIRALKETPYDPRPYAIIHALKAIDKYRKSKSK